MKLTATSKFLKSFLIQHGINRRFNIPRAPLWGRFFERMVRTVKCCLKTTLGNARVTYEEFETTLIEVKAVLNSRPLTYLERRGATHALFSVPRTKTSQSPAKHPRLTEDRNNPATDFYMRQKYLSTVLAVLLGPLEEGILLEASGTPSL